ncbi:hypothetical protein [Amycolatopsis ultiminotia]|uniref:hypothetical protein n=1 Tax=Amycolatopsis ultiminotia TaxID=543629 RepID=UPI0031E922A4
MLREHSPEELRETAARNAGLLLGFISAYSAGSILPEDTEVWLPDEVAAGCVAGPRLRAASVERDNHCEGHGSDKYDAEGSPDGLAAFVPKMATVGFGNVKLLLSNDDEFVEGGSHMAQYSDTEARAAHEAAVERVFFNCHAQSAESVKILVRNGFRAIYGSRPDPNPRTR